MLSWDLELKRMLRSFAGVNLSVFLVLKSAAWLRKKSGLVE